MTYAVSRRELLTELNTHHSRCNAHGHELLEQQFACVRHSHQRNLQREQNEQSAELHETPLLPQTRVDLVLQENENGIHPMPCIGPLSQQTWVIPTFCQQNVYSPFLTGKFYVKGLRKILGWPGEMTQQFRAQAALPGAWVRFSAAT